MASISAVRHPDATPSIGESSAVTIVACHCPPFGSDHTGKTGQIKQSRAYKPTYVVSLDNGRTCYDATVQPVSGN